MKVHVAVVQMLPEFCDREHNLDKMASFVKKIIAEKGKCDLIIFPELITTGYECGDKFYELAEIFPEGKSIDFVAKLAQEYNTHIIFGFAEKDCNMEGVLYNSVALIDNEGNPVGVYRKVHLFAKEFLTFRPGCEFPVFKTKIGNIGMMICWDTLFPEVGRILAIQGADLLVVSTNWEKPYSKEWDLMTTARAFDNTLHLAAANRIGSDKGELTFFGHSRILDPLGNVLAKIDEEVEAYISAEVDYDITTKLRREWTQLRERRPDAYEILTRRY